ncbi:MAG: sterol desaturase family protein [Myxacorys chilensis ATA2-1-KO14]|jgi:sterol desaturase/sphingolipid hydroxylase (fatty acid hydroxylase superfamily)|nr:sterol desaturase family protein [Myxacorys chilensis ATA2-1-KO14]
MVFEQIVSIYKLYAWVFLTFTVVELVVPIKRHSAKSYLIGVLSQLAYFAWTAVFLMVVSKINMPSLLHFNVQYLASDNRFPVIALKSFVLPCLPFLLFDFFYYWFHRLQHRSRLLWRFHRLHHSHTEMNIWNHVNHPLEQPLEWVFIVIPSTLCVRLILPDTGTLGLFLGVWGIIIHSNCRVVMPGLRHVLTTTMHHRIHHSREPQHYDRNFASIFPLYDRLFGTFTWTDKFPETGL